MICPTCKFNDEEPIAIIDGFRKVMAPDHADIFDSVENRQGRMTQTRNGIVLIYHLAHLAGAVRIQTEADGCIWSRPIFKDQQIAAMN